jgi:hypothetical protein
MAHYKTRFGARMLYNVPQHCLHSPVEGAAVVGSIVKGSAVVGAAKEW